MAKFTMPDGRVIEYNDNIAQIQSSATGGMVPVTPTNENYTADPANRQWVTPSPTLPNNVPASNWQSYDQKNYGVPQDQTYKKNIYYAGNPWALGSSYLAGADINKANAAGVTIRGFNDGGSSPFSQLARRYNGGAGGYPAQSGLAEGMSPNAAQLAEADRRAQADRVQSLGTLDAARNELPAGTAQYNQAAGYFGNMANNPNAINANTNPLLGSAQQGFLDMAAGSLAPYMNPTATNQLQDAAQSNILAQANGTSKPYTDYVTNTLLGREYGAAGAAQQAAAERARNTFARAGVANGGAQLGMMNQIAAQGQMARQNARSTILPESIIQNFAALERGGNAAGNLGMALANQADNRIMANFGARQTGLGNAEQMGMDLAKTNLGAQTGAATNLGNLALAAQSYRAPLASQKAGYLANSRYAAEAMPRGKVASGGVWFNGKRMSTQY